MGSEMCIRDRDTLPLYGVLDNLCGTRDWFWTAATTATENSFEHLDFDSDNELQCGWCKTIRLCAAKGMMLCERVPPDINVAMAMFATRLRNPVSTSLEIYVRSLRCLVGTRGETFDTSVATYMRPIGMRIHQ